MSHTWHLQPNNAQGPIGSPLALAQSKLELNAQGGVGQQQTYRFSFESGVFMKVPLCLVHSKPKLNAQRGVGIPLLLGAVKHLLGIMTM